MAISRAAPANSSNSGPLSVTIRAGGSQYEVHVTASAQSSVMLHRKFAVIKLWPELKTAEDECIARLKLAARDLEVECIEVDSFARMTTPPHTQLTSDDVDFVLSLHFETPKCYDIFS